MYSYLFLVPFVRSRSLLLRLSKKVLVWIRNWTYPDSRMRRPSMCGRWYRETSNLGRMKRQDLGAFDKSYTSIQYSNTIYFFRHSLSLSWYLWFRDVNLATGCRAFHGKTAKVMYKQVTPFCEIVRAAQCWTYSHDDNHSKVTRSHCSTALPGKTRWCENSSILSS